MNTPPSGPSVILSSAEPLHSKGTDSRFPFATAFAALTVIGMGLAIVPVLLFMSFQFDVSDIGWPVKLIGTLLGSIITFFIFRWAINKHILGNVAQATDALVEYGQRLSFKNPFLAGFIAYLALNMLISTVVDPIQELLAQDSASAEIILNLMVGIVVGYFAFTLAVKRVVLKPYSAKRLWPMLGLIIVLSISITFAISLAEVRQEWAFRNHVYCEVLRPGMTESEVTAALKEYGAQGQVTWDWKSERLGMEKATSFTRPYFDDFDLEYRLNLILGYDSNSTLVTVGRQNFDRDTYKITASAIECPLPFR